MKVSCTIIDVRRVPVDLLVVNLFEGVRVPGEATGVLDAAIGGVIRASIARKEFEGKEGEMHTFSPSGSIRARKVLIVGLGKREEFSLETVRKVGGWTIRKAMELKAKRIGTILHGAGIAGLEPRACARALTEGALLGGYRFLTYQDEERKRHEAFAPREVLVVERDGAKRSAIEHGIREALVDTAATVFSRDLVNEPAQKTTPAHLASVARMLARKPRISLRIYNRKKIESLKMGAFLGIARGSDEEPYFIHLTYSPKTKPKKRIVLVGKGITFDSGGLSLKPAQHMETMKIDMAGAATMLGVFSALPHMHPAIEIHGISAICENMPSGKAIRPGDIVRAMNGKTIEVINTDAEGRVTLADALSYAVTLKPDLIIDFATLTGGCVVALGEEIAGYMTNSREYVSMLTDAARTTGERIWELPLVKEYRELIRSDVADLRNSPRTRYADTIAAGLFLGEFVGKTPWIHLDIAGPAWAEKETLPYIPKGGTGFAVRTTLEFLRQLHGKT
ncbi:MAG: leucyl aminopeptidase [Parcubacteria group bacterium]|nr:leucyl aminopeptidase [Parcubacteria group bacterium]